MPLTILPTTASDIPALISAGFRAFHDTSTLWYTTWPLSDSTMTGIITSRQAGYTGPNATIAKPTYSFKVVDTDTNANATENTSTSTTAPPAAPPATILAAARWKIVTEPEDAGQSVEQVVQGILDHTLVPESRDGAGRMFYTALAQMRAKWLGMRDAVAADDKAETALESESSQTKESARILLRPRIDLDSLFTDPVHQGKGAARLLMQWGFDQADQLGLDIYLEASEEGMPFYKKLGFEEVDHFDVDLRGVEGADRLWRYTIMIRKPKVGGAEY